MSNRADRFGETHPEGLRVTRTGGSRPEQLHYPVEPPRQTSLGRVARIDVRWLTATRQPTNRAGAAQVAIRLTDPDGQRITQQVVHPGDELVQLAESLVGRSLGPDLL